MADPIAELNSVLTRCGITNQAQCTTIINLEGFTEVSDLGVLETDSDVNEMAKRMASCTVADGRVLLGTVVIKRLQTLVWWVRDRLKRGLPINANDFDADALTQASQMKTLRRETGRNGACRN